MDRAASSEPDADLRREVDELRSRLDEADKRAQREIKALNQEVSLCNSANNDMRLIRHNAGIRARVASRVQDLPGGRARDRAEQVQGPGRKSICHCQCWSINIKDNVVRFISEIGSRQGR